MGIWVQSGRWEDLPSTSTLDVYFNVEETTRSGWALVTTETELNIREAKKKIIFTQIGRLDNFRALYTGGIHFKMM